jgi:dGTPase
MVWEKLINQSRFGFSESQSHALNLSEFSNSEFERDVDRILFSSAFRRLQGKTQVYIFPHTDYVRNRMTHSLEVASIAKSLMNSIFNKMKEKSIDSSFTSVDVRNYLDIVVAASLAHDIGNPPFGHIGEYAIQSWFRDNYQNTTSSESGEIKNIFDFTSFDGNAQGFRILSKLQAWGPSAGGLQLTHSVLASMMKYPFDSNGADDGNRKFGFYSIDSHAAETVFQKTGIEKKQIIGKEKAWARHPLSYVMEAADDIAYLTSDIEDGVKFRLVPKIEATKCLINIAKKIQFNENRMEKIPAYSQDRFKYLRSGASIALIEACALSFVENYDNIMQGNSKIKDLIRGSESVSQYSDIPDLCEAIRKNCKSYIYSNEFKVSKEAGAYNIIRYLLDRFSEFVENSYMDKLNDRDLNIRRILQPKYDIGTDGSILGPEKHKSFAKDKNEAYYKVVDFISGMTDRFAFEIHERITGRSIALR